MSQYLAAAMWTMPKKLAASWSYRDRRRRRICDYGSDAVGRVANLILKSDYVGFSTSIRDGGASGGAGNNVQNISRRVQTVVAPTVRSPKRLKAAHAGVT